MPVALIIQGTGRSCGSVGPWLVPAHKDYETNGFPGSFREVCVPNTGVCPCGGGAALEFVVITALLFGEGSSAELSRLLSDKSM